MALSIRKAGLRDAATIARLGRMLNARLGEPSPHLSARALRRDGFGARPEFEVLLACDDDRVVGYALFHPSYESAHVARGLYLSDLLVTARRRRRGIGRALVAAVAAEARRRGRTHVWWVSKPWNAQAHAFYHAIGATHEPMVAHAIHGPAFERLADGAGCGPAGSATVSTAAAIAATGT